MKLLVATDGSDRALHAVRFAVDMAQRLPGTEIHLLNVQPPLPAVVTQFLQAGAARSFHEDCGRVALAKARSLLDEAGVRCTPHMRIGEAARTIVDAAAELDCNQIVMSTRGLGAVAGLVLGSTAMRVLHHAIGPVTLITGGTDEPNG